VCGTANRVHARFCHNCGAELQVQGQDASADDVPQAAHTISSIPPTPHPDNPGPGTGRGRWQADRGAQGGKGGKGGQGGREKPAGRKRQVGAELAPLSPWRPLAWAFGVLAVIALLVVAGWQLGWPSFVFAAKHTPSSAPPVSSAPVVAAHSPTATPLTTSPAVTQTTTTPSVAPSTTSPASPSATTANPAATTVEAYFAAINAKDYSKAWRLGGNETGTSYANFVHGFKGTRKDTVTILSVSGDVVTARLSALHTDHVVQVFQGTYTVQDGVIVSTDVQQVS
jgi:hypothetical protein